MLVCAILFLFRGRLFILVLALPILTREEQSHLYNFTSYVLNANANKFFMKYHTLAKKARKERGLPRNHRCKSTKLAFYSVSFRFARVIRGNFVERATAK